MATEAPFDRVPSSLTVACKRYERILESSQPGSTTFKRDNELEQAGVSFVWLVGTALSVGRYDLGADRYLAPGLKYCGDNGLELLRLYLLSFQAHVRLRPGPLGEGG